MLRKGSGDGTGFAGETAESNNITKSVGLRRVASGPATLTTSAWWTLAHNSLHITLCLASSLYTLGSSRFSEANGASCSSRGRTRFFFPHLQSRATFPIKASSGCDGDMLNFIMYNALTSVPLNGHLYSATFDRSRNTFVREMVFVRSCCRSSWCFRGGREGVNDCDKTPLRPCWTYGHSSYAISRPRC